MRLWDLSLALCFIASIVLLILIIARIVARSAVTRRKEIRAELLPALLSGASPADPLSGLPLKIAAGLVSELAELTRGEDREEMLARASLMGVPELLARRLKSHNAQVRLDAVEALSLFKDCTALTARALDDPSREVRLGAALALAHREDGPTARELVEKLEIGRKEHSLLLVSLMADLVQRNPGEVAALLFERDVPAEAKVAATDALGEAGGEYAPLLAYMANDSANEPDLQPRIFRALGRNGHPAAIGAIRKGLESPDWPVRASAAEAAGKVGASDAAPRLGELLADENWWVRHRAGEALLRLGPRGIAILRQSAALEEGFARSAATAILAESRAA